MNLWLEHFDKIGNVNENAVIVSTCVVTDRAKTKWIKEIQKFLIEGKKVYITGCGVIDQGKVFERDYFFDLYKPLQSWDEQIILLAEKPDILNSKAKENIYTKKFIVIQTGCDTHCNFCLTVLKRGKSKSISQQQIIGEISDFVESGGKEIVLTGINLAAYGASNTRLPKTNTFSDLLKSILEQTKIQRIRVSSLGPEFLDDRFFEIICDDRFLPHFHFSIQSFSDSILKSMNRNYDYKTLEYVWTKIKNLKRKDKDLISIGADLIVGFPGETDKDFQDTLDGVSIFGINKLHIFPFSAHQKYEKIPASDFTDQISKNIIKEREKKLIVLGDQIRQDFLNNNLNKTHQILIEEKKNGKRIGWTGNYIQVSLDGNFQRGEIVDLKLDKENIVF